MTNAEKYREDIENFKGNDFCGDFIIPRILKRNKCDGVSCNKCRMFQMIWLMEEYKEPEVDWSKVEVDTPILVKDDEQNKWERGYFAEYTDRYVFAWNDGRTSWTSNGVSKAWNYAKLAEEGDE